ncbi:MAG TPA: TolC family protein, partial [Bryobacteraceae bacterium]
MSAGPALVLLLALAVTCHAQMQGNANRSAGGDNSMPAAPSSYSTSSSQNVFYGSVPEGKASSTVLSLSFKDAIDRALRNNLGLLIGSDNELAAKGQKWQELSHLLPNVSAATTQAAEQIDLEALGFRFALPGIPTVIGPVGTFDSRVYMSFPFFDWHAIQRERGARTQETAANYNYKNARELVVLATGNAYLLTIAASARVDAAQAQVETAQALYNKARDQQTAGVTPAI